MLTPGQPLAKLNRDMLEIAKVLQVRVDEANLELATRQGQRDVYIKQCAQMLGIRTDVTFEFSTATFHEMKADGSDGDRS